MHIVYLTSEYPLPNNPHGGVGTFVKTLGTALLEKGHQVTIVGKHNAPDEVFEDNGMVIHYLQQSNTLFISGILNFIRLNKKLKEIYKKKPFDLVESPELGFAFIKKIPQVKYLIRLHGGHHFFAESENRKINWWKGLQEKLSFKKADYVVAVSNYVHIHTLKYLNFKEKSLGVIYNSTNLEKFYKAEDTKKNKNTILFSGTICEKKGIRQLIQALPIIKKEIPDIHLYIAGREWFYPKTKLSYTSYLKNFIDVELSNNITFLGVLPYDKIPEEIEKAHVCCFPSHMEAMPLAWIEVMCMGKAFVGSNKGPGAEIITNYKNGIAVDPLNIQELANAIIYMLNNKEEALKMGVNARKFALDNFDIHKIVIQNVALYSKIIS